MSRTAISPCSASPPPSDDDMSNTSSPPLSPLPLWHASCSSTLTPTSPSSPVIVAKAYGAIPTSPTCIKDSPVSTPRTSASCLCASPGDSPLLCCVNASDECTPLMLPPSAACAPRARSGGSGAAAFAPPFHRASLMLIYVLTLVAEAARGLLLPSLWPHFQRLGGQKCNLGILMASHAFGRTLSTVPVGHLSDAVSPARILTIASLVQAIGHGLYLAVPSPAGLCAARVIVGLGSATTSVARAQVVRGMRSHARTAHLAYLCGAQFVGFAVLPAVGGLLASRPDLLLAHGAIVVRADTYAALVLVAANVLCAVLVAALYKDLPERNTDDSDSDGSVAAQPASVAPRADVVALVVCLLINVVFRGVLSGLETVSIPFLTEQFGVPAEHGSMFISAIGLVGLCVYVLFRKLSTLFSDRTLVATGLVFIAAGCLPLAVPPLSAAMPLTPYVILLGFTWSVAYPVGQTAVLALFAKLAAGLPAGGLLGLYSASGALSPLVLSVVVGRLWSAWGRDTVFFFLTAFAGSAIVLLAVFFRRLRPQLPH